MTKIRNIGSLPKIAISQHMLGGRVYSNVTNGAASKALKADKPTIGLSTRKKRIMIGK